MVFKNRNRLTLDYDRFPGGIFNPSLVEYNGDLWGIARCEPYNQAERNSDKSLNFTSMQAVIFRLDSALEVAENHYDVRFENFPNQPWRTEDYRLFVFNGELLCTHTLWVQSYNIGMALSRVDLTKRTINLICPIDIEGVKLQGVEKNWVMISSEQTLHCLYQFYPDYTIAKLTNLSSAQFRLSEQCRPSPPTNGLADRLISLSTVPQKLGDAWYLLVHQKDEDHVYHDYLVRLNQHSLLPEVMSDDPVIHGGDCEGFWRGFLTVYSLQILGEQVVVSFGEGENYSSLSTAKTTELLAAL